MNTKLLLLLVITISIFSFNSNLIVADINTQLNSELINVTLSPAVGVGATVFGDQIQQNNTNVRFNFTIAVNGTINFTIINITVPHNITFTGDFTVNDTDDVLAVDEDFAGLANATNDTGEGGNPWVFSNSTDAGDDIKYIHWNSTDPNGTGGAVIFSINFTANNLTGNVDDARIDWNISITFADGGHEDPNSAASENSTVVYTWVDMLVPRLSEVNVTDGNATLVNGTAYGFEADFDDDNVQVMDHFSNKSATVYTTLTEINVDQLNMYYLCNSSVGEANVTFAAFYSNVSMSTSDSVSPYLFTGTIDHANCVNTENNATTFLFSITDDANRHTSVNDSVDAADVSVPFGFGVIGNSSLPVIIEVNITDQSRTLKLNDKGLRGGNDYLSSNSRMDINVDMSGRGFASDSDGSNQSFFYITNTTTESNTRFEDWFSEGQQIGLLNISRDIDGSGSLTSQFNGTIPKGLINDTDGTSGTSTGNFTNFLLLINDSRDYTQHFFGVFVVDGGDPTAKITSPADTNINVLNSIKYGCSGTDSVSGIAECKVSVSKPDGTVISKTSSNCVDQTFTNTDTNLPGAYTVECTVTDSVGYTSAKTTGAFDASTSAGTSGDSGGGGGGGTGTSRSGEELTLDADLSTSDASFTGKAGETKVFSLSGGDAHTVTFVEVTEDSVTITIESYKAEVTLNVGETKEVDMDGDGTPNVQVTLESITNGVAKLSFVKLSNVVPEEETEQEPSMEEKEEIPVGSGVTETGISLWTWVVLLAVLVLVGFVVFRVMKRK